MKPAIVFGYPKSHTPKFDITKNNVELCRMTPLLIFLGIPPAIAVASEANHIVGSSLSGTIGHLRRKAVDIRMGNVLLAGGILGSFLGIYIFNSLKQLGLVDLLITASYFLFLTAIGIFMLYESLDSLGYFGHKKRSKYYHHSWIMGLPLKIRFRRSGLYISLIPPYIIGIFQYCLLLI